MLVKSQSGFTLIETLIGAALLMMMVGFALQVQTGFGRNVTRQEVYQCISDRAVQVKKQIYHLRPLSEIEVEKPCLAPLQEQTDVVITSLSGTYPPTAPQECAELRVSIQLNGEEQFQSHAYACEF